MHIFCSVQYDLYFLFNVKLLTTHATDVAATSVNSKNKFCPFATALHYFSNIKKYRESKERKVNFRFMDLPESVVAGLSTSSSSSIKARMTSSPPELMESLSFLSLSSFSLLLCSSSSLSLSCKDSLSAQSLSLSRVCSINGSGPSGFIWGSQCLAITFTLSFLTLLMCWCSSWCLRYLLSSGTRSCFSLVES